MTISQKIQFLDVLLSNGTISRYPTETQVEINKVIKSLCEEPIIPELVGYPSITYTNGENLPFISSPNYCNPTQP